MLATRALTTDDGAAARAAGLAGPDAGRRRRAGGHPRRHGRAEAAAFERAGPHPARGQLACLAPRPPADVGVRVQRRRLQARSTPAASRRRRGRTLAPDSGQRAGAAGVVPGMHVAALPHTPGLCPGRRPASGHREVRRDAGRPPISVPGEPEPLWLLPVTCDGTTDAAYPVPIEVFRYARTARNWCRRWPISRVTERSIMVTAIATPPGGPRPHREGILADGPAVRPACGSARTHLEHGTVVASPAGTAGRHRADLHR